MRNFKADENLVSSNESSEQSFPWKWNLIPQNKVEVGYFLSQSDCRGALFFFPLQVARADSHQFYCAANIPPSDIK